MKKISLVALALTLMFSLSACNYSSDTTIKSDGNAMMDENKDDAMMDDKKDDAMMEKKDADVMMDIKVDTKTESKY